MGPPKSGKSDLMALLAGKRIIGADLALGSVRLQYGDTVASEITLTTGEVRAMGGVPTTSSLSIGEVAAETTIFAPLPALRKISLMQLGAVNNMSAQVKAMDRVAQDSDIVIWCTSRYTPVEHKMWVQMPEKVRDNAFVLRSNLDGFDNNYRAARSDLGRPRA